MNPIPFTIKGQEFEAVSFLNEGEDFITGHEVLKRVPDAITNEDYQLIIDNLSELPEELQRYCLMTNVRNPDDPEDVYCVYWLGVRWVQHWYWLDYHWGDNDRVLRRRSSLDARTLDPHPLGTCTHFCHSCGKEVKHI